MSRDAECRTEFAQTAGCLKCANAEWVRGKYFCGGRRLTEKQLYNEKGYCSRFVGRGEKK